MRNEPPRYATVVIDPPWAVKRGPVWGSKGQATRELPYSTMSLHDIRKLPVATLAAPDAHLYLWTINAYIDAAYSLASSW